MRTYDFTLIFSTDPGAGQIERLYKYFGADGDAPEPVQSIVMGQRCGVPYAGCTVEAESFESALRAVLPAFRREGLDIERVEVGKEDLTALEAA